MHDSYDEPVPERPGVQTTAAQPQGRVVHRSPAMWLLRGPIRFYQLAISPMSPAACRYYPSCSNYAIEAIDKYGALKGGWLAVRRILRCHPFRPGGFDPVP